MKSTLKILFTLSVLVLFETTVISQVTLEYQGPRIAPSNSWFSQDGNYWGFYSASVSATETKFLEYEASGSNVAVTFYNYDFSIFDNILIDLQLPSGVVMTGFDIYVSRNTFDLDNDFEIFVQTVTQDTLASFPFLYSNFTRIYEHNGLIKHDFGNLTWGNLHEIDNKALIMFQSERVNDTIFNDTTVIYSFPGQLLSSIGHDEQTAQEAALKNFPNPFGNSTTIEFDLPKNISVANLNVFDQTGKMIKTLKVNSRFGKVLLNTNDFGPGLYFYNLESEGEVLNSKKMIKAK
ncbi:MAG: T9SS type A sorting domain-containing protein [Flavobacteriales bacterium]|nr:T9SS type A sorting domain-containing protein [Flavobacteriales bacterium]